ncbi:RDD family protein [Alkalihalophilus marmarensis]|uniref:RDD family protein n=1 Tax=Alkalihalophilus marmarensis TaxID=521377 RepID=UPI002DBC200B|nr:RDD family protein [Alkalihalophilus marmarensis]MEC2071750.1 RDD family protein [Alkalihalophilus marmarensis]
MEQGMINRGSRPRRSRILQQRKKRQERSLQPNRESESLNRQEEIELETHYTKERHYAGFWMRFWAFSLDALMLLSLRWLLIGPILNLTDLRYALGGMYGFFDLVVSAVFFFAYFALMTKFYGATIGKMVFGLRVVSKEGDLLSWREVIFREGVGRVLHQSFALLYILYITVAFTSTKQGLHDMIADSYVIYEKR